MIHKVEVRSSRNHFYLRSIRLEDVCDTSGNEGANESVIPDVLPALLHVLLTGSDAEEPASWWVVVVAMVCGTEAAPGREALNVLRLAKKAARAKEMGNWPSRHLENGGADAAERVRNGCSYGCVVVCKAVA